MLESFKVYPNDSLLGRSSHYQTIYKYIVSHTNLVCERDHTPTKDKNIYYLVINI